MDENLKTILQNIDFNEINESLSNTIQSLRQESLMEVNESFLKIIDNNNELNINTDLDKQIKALIYSGLTNNHDEFNKIEESIGYKTDLFENLQKIQLLTTEKNEKENLPNILIEDYNKLLEEINDIKLKNSSVTQDLLNEIEEFKDDLEI